MASNLRQRALILVERALPRQDGTYVVSRDDLLALAKALEGEVGPPSYGRRRPKLKELER